MNADYSTNRHEVLQELQRRGFKDGQLQWIWRTKECFTRHYDAAEVIYAICDALTREGCTAWNGDGTSCVEQMIRLQVERAVAAEKERDENMTVIKVFRRQLAAAEAQNVALRALYEVAKRPVSEMGVGEPEFFAWYGELQQVLENARQTLEETNAHPGA